MKLVLLAALFIGLASDVMAQVRPSAEQLMEERRQANLIPPVPPAAGSLHADLATNNEILTALNLTTATGTSAQSGAAAAFGTFATLGVIGPTAGAKFVALSTGTAGTTSPEPGTDFSPSGVSGDKAVLTLTLKVPAGANRLRFAYRFLSAEYPEYVGTQFNDTFSAKLVSGTSSTEVGRSSVNSALFYPVSKANAGGSGFDITEPDGDPDAGLTNWIPVSASVTPNSTVTLTLSVEDIGDGVYDSAVLISELSFADVEIVDATPTFVVNGQLTTDINALAKGGRPVRGAAADGVARLLLRAVPSGASTVRFTLVGASAADGGLTPIGGGPSVLDMTVPVVSTADGPRAYAVYVAPEGFSKPGFENAAERTVTLRVSYLSGAIEQSRTESSLAIVRPPVVFIHGLWGEGGETTGTWAGQPLFNDARYKDRLTIVDYRSTNAHPFATNVALVHDWIVSTLAKIQQDRIAAVQVDVVAHSMGGVLARLYGARSDYRRSVNYMKGDFNRLITVNTPHAGSPLANLLVQIRESQVGPIARSLFAGILGPIDLGAIDDLREGSCALQIPALDIPSHALAGTGGSDGLDAVSATGTVTNLASSLPLQPAFTQSLFRTASFLTDILGISNTVIYAGRKHDLLVPLDSELGGMPLSAQTTLAGLATIHTSAPAATLYATRLMDLMNMSTTAPEFSGFPIAGGKPAAAACLPLVASVTAAVETPVQGLTLAVVGPTSVASGATVQFSVTPLSGFSVTRVAVVGPGVAQTTTTAPFLVSLVVPAAEAGAFKVTAAGVTSSGGVVSSNTVSLQVAPASALQQILLAPGNIVFTSLNSGYTVTATGTYADGVTRGLNDSGLLTFSSSNTSVATVDATGKVTSLHEGYTTIRASSGTIQNSVSVTVNTAFDQPPPAANAGPDQAVVPNTLVTLIGTVSGVPTGMTPGFEWSQVAGPAVTLNGQSALAASFTPSTAGTYVFSLVARAGLSESAPDSVAVTVGAAAGPQISLQPQSQTIVKTQTAVFSVEASGIPTPVYQWRRNGIPVTGATGSGLAITNVQPTDVGTYTVLVSNTSGSLTSNAASLVVQTPAEIATHPASVTVLSGETAQFSVVGSGNPTPTYQWQTSQDVGSTWSDILQGGPFSGVSTPTLTITGVLTSLSGTLYRCAVANSVGSATSTAAALTVNAGPAFTTHPANQLVDAGQSAQFSVIVTGAPVPALRWQVSIDMGSVWTNVPNASPYSGITSGTLIVAGVTAGLNGAQYRAVATSSAGSATSNVATLTVKKEPPVTKTPEITANPASQSITAGQSAQFSVTVIGAPAPAVQWQLSTTAGASWVNVPNIAPYDGTTTATLSIAGATAGLNGTQYRAVATNSVGSATSGAAMLTVNTVPTFSTHPIDRAIGSGQNTQFRVAASGSPAPAFQWQLSINSGGSWANLIDGGRYSGAATDTLTITGAIATLSGGQYRCVAVNAAGSTISLAASLTVALPTLEVDRPAVQFAATTSGTAFVQQTASQTVRLLQTGPGVVSWTAVPSDPWISVSPSSGTGPATLTIGILFDPGLPVGGTASGTIALSLSDAASTAGAVGVGLTLITSGAATAPVGVVDTPAEGASGLTGSVAVTGWALDDIEVTRVRIMRNPVGGEGTAPIFIGNAVLVDGSRPDVSAALPKAPLNTRAGWGYLMLTNFLPNQGNGTFTLSVFADDADGHSTLLGTRTITCTNDTATRPFGAIDTPGQGETISGTAYSNFGWVLARKPALAYAPFGTVSVIIDGVVGPAPAGWVSRPDLTAAFPIATYPGVMHALAVASIDTTALANGVHTIAWIVRADNGEEDGIGSRFFTVANSNAEAIHGAVDDLSLETSSSARAPSGRSVSLDTPALMIGPRADHASPLIDDVNAAPLQDGPIAGRRGLETVYATLPRDSFGHVTVQGEELDRFEVLLNGDTRAPADGSTLTGYMRVGAGLGPLPIGSQLDPEGVFSWLAGVGFVRSYDLVFVRWVNGRAIARQEIRVVINPRN